MNHAVHQVSIVRDLEALSELEAAWEAVHRVDPEATVFTSWAWIQGRLATLAEPWCVLVARSADGTIDGLLPLRHVPTAEAGSIQGLTMAGSPLADYTGFLCDPAAQESVLAALASYVQDHLQWQRFEIRDARDARLEDFLDLFSPRHFEIEHHPKTPCPYIDLEPFLDLEDPWEAYLQTCLSSRTRYKVRLKMRKIRRLPSLRYTGLEDGGESQLKAMLKLWQMRWGERPESELAQFRSVFSSCLEADCLRIGILWDGDLPISGRLNFLDRKNSSTCDYITSHDRSYAKYAPGIVIAAYTIRTALQGGYRTYDFLRGDEEYKFSLGAELRHTDNVTILRKPAQL